MLKRSVFERILRLLPLLAAFLTPLLFFVDCRDQFELPKLTFLALTGALFLGIALYFGKKPRITPLGISLLVLFLFQIISSLPQISLSWSTSLLGDYENFSGLLACLGYLLWFFALQLVLDENLIERTSYYAVLAAVLSAGYALLQFGGFDFVQWNPETVIGNREFASLGNPNFLAAYLALCIPLLLLVAGRHALNDRPQTRIKGYVLFTALGLLGIAILVSGTGKGAGMLNQDISNPPVEIAMMVGLPFLCLALLRYGNLSSWLSLGLTSFLLILGLLRTGSRGGFLGAITGLTLFAVLILTSSDLRKVVQDWISRIPRIVRWGSLLALITTLFTFNMSFVRRLGDTVLHFTENVGTSRLHIWKPALRIIQENPFFGVGLDNFKIAFPHYTGFEFNKIDGIFVSSRTAHNELLQTAATTGLFGLLAYLTVLAVFIWTWKKAYSQSSLRSRWMLAGLLASATAYQTQNLFSFGVSSINFVWIFILAATQVLAFEKDPAIATAPTPLRYSALRVPGVALLTVLAFFSIIRLSADVAFGRGSAALEYLKASADKMSPQQKDDYSQYAIMMINKATERFPAEVKYRLYQGLAFERRADIDRVGSKEWLLKAQASYKQAVSMSPFNAYYHNNMERIALGLFNVSKDPADLALASQSGRRAVDLAPASPFFKVQWAFALKKAGNEKEASRLIAESFDLSRDFTSKALAQLGVDEYQKGNTAFALELLDEAVKGNTLSAEAYYYRGLILEKTGKKKAGFEDLEKAVRLNPRLTGR